MEQDYIQSIIQNYEKDLQKVKQDAYALQFVKKQTPELCWEAVKQEGYALYYIKKQTLELCLAAVKNNKKVLNCVRDPILREQIKQHFNL